MPTASGPAEPPRPTLMFVTPVRPALTGNGLAMRAGATLLALAGHYRVTLAAIPLYASVGEPFPEELATACEAIFDPAVGTNTKSRWWHRSPAIKSDSRHAQHYDVIHVFRLVTARLIEKHLPPIKAGSMHLDLDDVESATHMRIAGLYRINGDTLSAAREEREARESALQEQDALNRFDRVYVCTPADRELLAGRGPAEVRILPNTIRCSSRSQTAPDIPFTFLLLGTLGYFPNQDAARYFCAQVLPLIRDMAPADVRVTIAGSGAGRQLKELDRVRGVTVAGEVSQVEGLYRSASAVVVPVRAGGGTRIKILEAFCHGRPVVSTSMGMEGIEARDWEHALIADDPEVFAQRCVQLMHDPDLIERMTRNARELVSREYSPEVAARSVAR